MSQPNEPVMITRIAIPESNARLPHPDDCTSVPLSSLRPGALFSTVTGFRGIKIDDPASYGVPCVSYDTGGIVVLERDTKVWEHVWGGWLAVNAKEHASALPVPVV